MAYNATPVYNVPNVFLWCSVVFKFMAMIIGVFGNVTVIIYIFFSCREKTATSYLIGHLAVADLLVCLTFYPIWIIEFLRTIFGIDSDQEFFCKLSRSTTFALTFASVSSLLSITVDRYLYFVKPLKYPMIVTCRRVFLAVSGIWLTTCWLFILFFVHFRSYSKEFRSFCDISKGIYYFKQSIVGYVPLILIFFLNSQIFCVARKQRKRIMAETKIITVNSSNEESAKKMSAVLKFFIALKAAKTFAIVVAVLTFCILAPTVVSLVLFSYFSKKNQMFWYLFFNYDLYGINSIVNAFIYGIRHVKYRKGYVGILLKILTRHKPVN